MTRKVIHDRSKCAGCGACVRACPEFWSMGRDGKAKLANAKKVKGRDELEINDEDLECNERAARVCRFNAITIT